MGEEGVITTAGIWPFMHKSPVYLQSHDQVRVRGYRRQTGHCCGSPAAFVLLQASFNDAALRRSVHPMHGCTYILLWIECLQILWHLDPTNLLMYGDRKAEVDVWVNKQRQGKVPEIPDGCTSGSVYRIWTPPQICDMLENIDSRGKNNINMAANGSRCQHESKRAADWLAFVWGLEPRW